MVKKNNQECLKKLIATREKVNWEIEDERREFLQRLYPLVKDWKGTLPNLRDIFQKGEIDWLLLENEASDISPKVSLIKFVVKTGYKDEPEVDENGKLLLRRTTGLHRANQWRFDVVNLFKVYDRFDVNYVDESGLTHLHMACKHGLVYVVEKFLRLGQDPNSICRETGDSPLHSAVIWDTHTNNRVIELLLEHGANPNVANNDGSTPMHICANKINASTMAEPFFEAHDDKRHTVLFDARDKWGQTPLHYALAEDKQRVARMLLERRADRNLVNAEGSTPLHILCQNYRDIELLQTFFKIDDKVNQPIEVDARDKLGRTPLQLAVAGVMPNTVDILLNHGADLSEFIFPTLSRFEEVLESVYRNYRYDSNLGLESRLLLIVDNLKERGYELDQSEALTIMKLFAKRKTIEKSAGLDECWSNNEQLASEAKNLTINPSLSLCDLIQLRPEEARKQFTYLDYLKFIRMNWNELCTLSVYSYRESCRTYLFEILSRGFFRRWAEKFLLVLTCYRLPILCCEKIVDLLANEDLMKVCLAAEIVEKEESQRHDIQDEGNEVKKF